MIRLREIDIVIIQSHGCIMRNDHEENALLEYLTQT